MNKIELLKNEIAEAIQKIGTLDEKNRLEVYLIYSNIYQKYIDLSREDFNSQTEFDKHCYNVKSDYSITQLELSNLQDMNSTVDVQSNFAQVRITLHNLFRQNNFI